jgi:parallel beta-helix repeat protein
MKKEIFILFFFTLLLLTNSAMALTIVNGNVYGTWTLNGSPYYMTDVCTVPTGEILTIEPGVEVVISEDVSFDINGQILAIGTEFQPIIFRAVNNTVKYARIYVLNGSSSPPISEFKHCYFQNAVYGLYLHAYGRIDNAYTTLQTDVSNCVFDNSVTTGIYVEAQAVDASQYMTPRRRSASNNPVINGCIFSSSDSGVIIYTNGAGQNYYSRGTSEAVILNNFFFNQGVSTLNTLSGSHVSSSAYPLFINNTIVNSSRGVWIQDTEHDVIIKNNIFLGNMTSIERTGTLSLDVSYNCFFNNATNFVGYPSAYGDVVITNVNGTPCDVAQNIYVDPLLKSNNDAHLTMNSPAIDAGTSIDAPANDIDHQPRPSGSMFDIGADEYYDRKAAMPWIPLLLLDE